MKIFRIFVAIMLVSCAASSVASAQQPASGASQREERTMSVRFAEDFPWAVMSEEKLAAVIDGGAFNSPDGSKVYTSIGGQGDRELFATAKWQLGNWEFFYDRNVVIRNEATQELAWQLSRIPGFGGYNPSYTISRLTYEDASVQSAPFTVEAVVVMNDPSTEKTLARGTSSERFIMFRKDQTYGTPVYQLGVLRGRQISLIGEFTSQDDALYAGIISQTISAALKLGPYRTVIKAQGGAVQP